MFKAGVPKALSRKLVALGGPTIPQRFQASGLTHLSARLAWPIDALQCVGLEALKTLILGVSDHGVVDF